jgi:hypothetical protein
MGGRTRKADAAKYRRYVESMIDTDDAELLDAMEQSRYAVGDESFIEQTEQELREMRLEREVTGDVVLPEPPRVGLDEIEGVVADEYGVDVRELHRHGRRAGEAKTVAVEMMCRLSGLSQRDVARHFAYRNDAGVAGQRRVLRERLSADGKLAQRVNRLQRRLLLKHKKQV